jgi:hypothetical protein
MGDSHEIKRKCERQDDDRNQRIKFSPKDTPGVICIERQIHNEAVVISGSLTIESDEACLDAWIEEEVGIAVGEIKGQGGVVGQIKAALTITSTSVITVTDEKKTAKESPQKYARIMLAAIMFMVDPKEAENIIRKALAGVRARFREKNNIQ